MYRKLRTQFLLPVVALAVTAIITGIVINLFYQTAYPVHWADEVERYSEEFGVEKSLVFGVIHTESSFRPEAVSPVGARGLMQITEETFDWAKWRMGDADTSYEDLFEPESNIKYGTYILSLLIEEFDDTSVALAAYHAGWGNVKKWLDDKAFSDDGRFLNNTPFAKTNDYVVKVNKATEIYRKLLEGKD